MFFKAQNVRFVWYKLPRLPEYFVRMFGADFCDMVAQLFVCCLRGGIVVFTGCYENKVPMSGTSLGSSSRLGINRLYFWSKFSGVLSFNFPHKWEI